MLLFTYSNLNQNEYFDELYIGGLTALEIFTGVTERRGNLEGLPQMLVLCI